MVPDRDPRLDRLYDLLPAIHRRRDAETGNALRALLEIIAEQMVLIEDDIGQRYDDAFIETCAPWAIPYIGALVGVALPGAAAVPSRRTVANAIRDRRRKGSLAVLAALARNAGDWPARAVEMGPLLAQSQSLRMPQPARGRSIDVRSPAMAGAGFDSRATTADLRRDSARASGRLPVEVGLHLWRLRAFSVTRAPAACLEDIAPNFYSFSVLGNDAPLFNAPPPGTDTVAGPADVPAAIDRHSFAAPRPRGSRVATANPAFYGTRTEDGASVARSVAIWAKGWPNARADGAEPIPADRIIVADLEDWLYQPPRDHVAIDPVRGRIAFPPRQLPRRQASVTVSYWYGFSAAIGGGEYSRPLSQHDDAEVISVQGSEALRRALLPWQSELDDAGNMVAPATQPPHAVIEITDSGVYTLPIAILIGKGNSLQLRAAQHCRPVIKLADFNVDAPDSMSIAGAEGSRFVLDGIMVAGRGVALEGGLTSVTIRHATLVPGWSLEPDCDPRRPAEPSIEITDSGLCLVVEHSIIGSIQINNDEVHTEPIALRVSDSIVDATGADCDSPQCEALGAAGSRLAFATACFSRSTVIGRIHTHALTGENCLFLGRITVARRQIGHLRFCYVAPQSRTPRRFRCQPDLTPGVAPRFDSLRYGQPRYCRLASDCPPEISAGADDGNEMGVFHHLQTTRRLAGLAAALDDMAPVGTAPGVVLAD
ncbi:hypothetical protein [Polymorphobacter fuscus]|uniref:Uncharacterized protein n=1 Tax=Sandarakinorhabdus fusca TaxID=1439888 RepID=A0A7C9LG75_9SPHN|nr:hypothetical protein [Polymorphobacter fuscus]KAB7647941.1 hypothetical protein F9290_08315 [Polymorphobacter fuscus]MQT17267.1 hypothetical protein [Polymorphobacter fuscus]NJC08738.1 hypothetical protein [Polymorphobacter fuscus]